MTPTLKQVLDQKGTNVFTIAPDASVLDAIRLMAEKGIGLLLVTEPTNPLPVGVISERDYARKIILQGRQSGATPVSEIMTREVRFGDPAGSIYDGMSMMTEGRFRHLPLLEDGRVIGIVSLGDLVKEVIADQRFRIKELEKYIAS